MRVFVTGGTGYVGQPIVRRLLSDGHEVCALVRKGSPRVLSMHPRLNFIEGDLFADDAMSSGMKDCGAVIHLVGIIKEIPRRQITMHRIHVEGTNQVLTCAKQAGVSHFLHMSALGSRKNAVSNYHRSKWEAEELVRQSDLPHTIFQPSVVYGRGGPGPHFVQQLTQLVKYAPIVPILGDGSARLQPVPIHSLATMFSTALVEAVALGRCYEVGGADVITYGQILRIIATLLHRKLRTFRLPLPLASFLIPRLQRLPKFPITNDQLAMLKEGNVCADPFTVYRELGLQAVPFNLNHDDLPRSR